MPTPARQAAEAIAAWLAGRARLARRRADRFADRRRRRQSRVPARRAGVAETVTIAALGHSGDGIAETRGRPRLRAADPARRNRRDRARRRAAAGCFASSRRAPSASRRSAAISANAAPAPSSIWQRAAYLAWKREPGRSGLPPARHRAPTSSRPCRSGRAAAAGRSSRWCGPRAASSSASTAAARTTSSPSRNARCWCPASSRSWQSLREIAGVALKPGRPGRLFAVARRQRPRPCAAGAERLDRRTLEALGRFAGDPAIARLTVDGTGSSRAAARKSPPTAPRSCRRPAASCRRRRRPKRALAEAVARGRRPGSAGRRSLRRHRHLHPPPGTARQRLAVDGDEAALQALDAAARRTRGLKPITARKRDLFHNPLAPDELRVRRRRLRSAGAPAPRRRPRPSPPRRWRASSRSPATRRRSPAMPASSSTAATG